MASAQTANSNDLFPIDSLWKSYHLTLGLDPALILTEGEDANSIAAHAELRTAPSLGEEPVLLALMGLTVLVVEGGGEGHRKRRGAKRNILLNEEHLGSSSLYIIPYLTMTSGIRMRSIRN